MWDWKMWDWKTWFWIIPALIIGILLIVDFVILVYSWLSTSLGQVQNIQATYVSTDQTTATETWTVSWDPLADGATYIYYFSNISYIPNGSILPPPLNVTSTTSNTSVTFNNLPSSSTFEFSIYATRGSQGSQSNSIQFVSNILDGDLIYISDSIGNLITVQITDTETTPVLQPQQFPYSFFSLFTANIVQGQTGVYTFQNSGNYLYSDENGNLNFGFFPTPLPIQTQFNVIIQPGGFILQSLATNQYVAFTGPYFQGFPTGVCTSTIPQLFALVKTVYFGNGSALSITFANTGTSLQYAFNVSDGQLQYDVLSATNAFNDNIANQFIFIPQMQQDGSIMFAFLFDNLSTFLTETFGVCEQPMITSQPQISTSFWTVVPINTSQFMLRNTTTGDFLQYCSGCCSSTGVNAVAIGSSNNQSQNILVV